MAESTFQGVTTSFPFFSCNSSQTPLFSVNTGVPAEDALAMVSCFLDDALTAMNQAEEVNFAAHRLMTMAKAVLDATIQGIPESGQSEAATTEHPQGKTRYFEVIAQFHRLHRDGVLLISPDTSDLDEAEALFVFDTACTIACGSSV